MFLKDHITNLTSKNPNFMCFNEAKPYTKVSIERLGKLEN